MVRQTDLSVRETGGKGQLGEIWSVTVQRIRLTGDDYADVRCQRCSRIENTDKSKNSLAEV